MPPVSRLPRKAPSQRRSSITVEAIVQAAIHIFEDEGYRAATTIKIAEKAGVSVGSLYQYFPNKLALLAEVKQATLAELFARLKGVLDAAPDCASGLRAAVHLNLSFAFATRRRWLIFAEELPARLSLKTGKPSEAPHVVMLRRFFQLHGAGSPGRDPAMAALVVAEMVDAVTRAALQERPADLINGVLETELLAALSLYLHGRPAGRKRPSSAK
jgi:AcrR family transcriptional regulator